MERARGRKVDEKKRGVRWGITLYIARGEVDALIEYKEGHSEQCQVIDPLT